jgi:predicted ATPase
MKILELEYEDKTTGWKLEKTKFDDFNLLVGVSGVGKSKILKAIGSLKAIALGIPQNGIKWNVLFLDSENVECKWNGEYEVVQPYYKDEFNFSFKPSEPALITESLFKNRKSVFTRDLKKTKFNGKETPKLSPYESAIKLFSADEEIISVANSLKQIFQSYHYFRTAFSVYLRVADEVSSDFNKLMGGNLDATSKLFLTYKHFPKVFEKVKYYFTEIFPSVTDIRFRKQRNPSEDTTESVKLEIKEKGNSNWINSSDISEGMLKTLVHISQIYLYPEGSIVLIDEFENSLGVNAIDAVTDLLWENRHIQFIITSHHPYIINNISPKYWKIVTRKGSIVNVKDVDEKSFARSNHEAFIKLLNLPEYREGIAA